MPDGPPAGRGPDLVPVRRPGLAAASEDSPTGLVGVLLTALLLRLWQLGDRSVWTDEGTAWTAATLPLGELIEFCRRQDASPPLYYLLTGLALRLGDGETQLRLVSVLASTALVWVTYRFARLLADRRTATIAAALMALSPFQIMYAQEARSYALVALWTVLSLHLFARAVLLERRRAWIPLVLVTALGLWTQSIVVLGIGTQAAFVALTGAGRRNALRWAGAMAAAFALYAPWLVLSAQGPHLASSHWYLKQPDERTSFGVARALFLSPVSLVTPPITATLPGLEQFVPRLFAWAVLLAAPLAPLALGLARVRDPGSRGTLARFVAGALALPLLSVFLISFLRPLWLARYFVFLGPMVAILIALGVRALRPRALSMAWFGLLLMTAGYASFRYFTDYSKEPWRQVAARAAAGSDPARTAVVVTFDPDPFLYYNARLPRRFPVFAAAHPAVPFHDAYTPRQLDELSSALRESTTTYDEVWVVVRSPNSPVRKEVARRARETAAIGRVAVTVDSLDSFQGKLRFAHYRRPRLERVPGATASAETLRAR